jgi:hypothetical protein
VESNAGTDNAPAQPTAAEQSGGSALTDDAANRLISSPAVPSITVATKSAPVSSGRQSPGQELIATAQGEEALSAPNAAPIVVAQGQTCADFIAENCKGSILRVFPGQFLDLPVDDMLDAAKSGDAAARTARKLLFDNRFRKWPVNLDQEARMSSALFEIIKSLESAHVHFFLERTRPDAIRVSANFVGERWEIDVFEDDHVEISRFCGNEEVEGGMELLHERLLDEGAGKPT